MAVTVRGEGRTGQIVVVSAFMFLVLGLFLALSVDIGRIALARCRQQNAADAASLAAAHVLVAHRDDGADETAAREAARQEALALQQANACLCGLVVQFGTADEDTGFEQVGTGVKATAVRIAINRDVDAPGGTLPLFFAPLAGMARCAVKAMATAAVGASMSGVFGNLGPFALPQDRIGEPGDEIVFYPADPNWDPGIGDDSIVPANWGLLDLNGGGQSNTELKDWIENGYDEGLEIPDGADHIWIEGTTGFRAGLGSLIAEKIGEPMVMLVYDEVIGQGANGEFRVVGFVVVTITEVQLTGSDKQATCRISEVHNLHDVTLGGSWESPNMRKVQIID